METEAKQEDASPDPILIDLDRGVKTIETPYNCGYTSDTKSTRKPKKVPYKMGKKKKKMNLLTAPAKHNCRRDSTAQRKIIAYKRSDSFD
ncbi:hypothetical protein Bca101_078928 [Brassica carinata]